jgi:hypothetical protein
MNLKKVLLTITVFALVFFAIPKGIFVSTKEAKAEEILSLGDKTSSSTITVEDWEDERFQNETYVGNANNFFVKIR